MTELTEKEKEVLKKYLDGEFDHFTCSDDERIAMTSVIDKADKLVEELNAYNEIGDDLIRWFNGKLNQ